MNVLDIEQWSIEHACDHAMLDFPSESPAASALGLLPQAMESTTRDMTLACFEMNLSEWGRDSFAAISKEEGITDQVYFLNLSFFLGRTADRMAPDNGDVIREAMAKGSPTHDFKAALVQAAMQTAGQDRNAIEARITELRREQRPETGKVSSLRGEAEQARQASERLAQDTPGISPARANNR